MELVKIDTSGLTHKELNAQLREAVESGAAHIELTNVHGQRYIGTGLRREVQINIFGTPGNDLAAFMDGPRIVVHGNAQDGIGNTMNSGEIVVHGHAGDIVGLAARGGKIFIREGVGYRAGIHMKEYEDKKPVLVIGGTAQDFLGEYMAGGIIIVLELGLQSSESHKGRFIGTGMHGGAIYLSGAIQPHQLGKEVGTAEPSSGEYSFIEATVKEFCTHFGNEPANIMAKPFIKLFPLYLRPYGRLYAY
jgi:glutamate synthase domain-containing protein 3